MDTSTEKPYTFAFFDGPNAKGWWLMLTPNMRPGVIKALQNKFGTDWFATVSANLQPGKAAYVNSSGGYHIEDGNPVCLRREFAMKWPTEAPSATERLGPDDLLKNHVLAGLFYIKGELIICSKCGRNLSEPARVMGNRDMVLAMHAFWEGRENYRKAVEAFHAHREKIADEQMRKEIDLQFAIVIGSVVQLERAIVASNGLLGDGGLHPRGIS